MPRTEVVRASPNRSLLLHLIDGAPVAPPQELPRGLVLLGLLGAFLLQILQQSTGHDRRDRDLIVRDETLWAEAWCQWNVKEFHFLQGSDLASYIYIYIHVYIYMYMYTYIYIYRAHVFMCDQVISLYHAKESLNVLGHQVPSL